MWQPDWTNIHITHDVTCHRCIVFLAITNNYKKVYNLYCCGWRVHVITKRWCNDRLYATKQWVSHRGNACNREHNEICYCCCYCESADGIGDLPPKSLSKLKAAEMRARWEKACGKLPSCLPFIAVSSVTKMSETGRVREKARGGGGGQQSESRRAREKEGKQRGAENRKARKKKKRELEKNEDSRTVPAYNPKWLAKLRTSSKNILASFMTDGLWRPIRVSASTIQNEQILKVPSSPPPLTPSSVSLQMKPRSRKQRNERKKRGRQWIVLVSQQHQGMQIE